VPEAPPGVVDQVHFTVTAPPVVAPKESCVINIWAHLEEQRQAVLQRAKEFFGYRQAGVATVAASIERGTTLTIRLSVDDLVLTHPENTLLWTGNIGNATFSAKVPAEAAPGAKAGLALIYVNGIQIGRIDFIIQVGEASSLADRLPSHEQHYRKAFISYASPDRSDVLARVQGMRKVAPALEIFLDAYTLRSGQDWEQALWHEIPECDVFYLFWSKSAAQSDWVKKEWQCALATRGPDFIDPVPLVSPKEAPPPAELSSKHFNDWEIAFIYMERYLELIRLEQTKTASEALPVTVSAASSSGTRDVPEPRGRKDEPTDAYPLFEPDGHLKVHLLTATTERVLQRARDLAQRDGAAHVDIRQVMMALLDGDGDGLWLAALTQQGFPASAMRAHLQKLSPPIGAGSGTLQLVRADFSAGLLAVLSEAHRAARSEGSETLGERHLLLGWAAQGDPTLNALTTIGLDVNRLRQTLVWHALFGPEGKLLLARLCPPVQLILDEALHEALRAGYEHLSTPHLFGGLLNSPSGWFLNVLRSQGIDATRLREAVWTAAGPGQPRRLAQIPFVQTAFSPGVLHILRLAETIARREGAACIEEKQLGLGFMQGVEGLTRQILEQHGVNLAGMTPAPLPETWAQTTRTATPEAAAVPRRDAGLFLPDGQLNRALFDEPALRVLEQAVQAAHVMNHAMVGTPHLVIGLVQQPNGFVGRALRTQALRPEDLQGELVKRFAAPAPPTRPAQLARDSCSPNLHKLLLLAGQIARGNAGESAALIGERELFLAFLSDGGGQAGQTLEGLGLKRREMLIQMGVPLATPTLDKLGTDLTRQAREGKLAPVFGREKEIQEIIEALTMKTKNNPLLVGEAGVGKTAIVEGLAQRIAQGAVPEHLQGKRLVQLQMGTVVAGTMYRGQFEERIRHVLEEAQHPDIILFIDEIHTLVGAGAAEGAALDAGNLLKPALARGEMRVIGATTPQEASRTIEKDAALERRFARIEVREPDEAETLDILRQLRPDRAAHYGVTISDEALTAAVNLVVQHVPERRLPDKAVEALDRACAKVVTNRTGRLVVDAEAVALAVGEWRNIPLGQLTKMQQAQLLQLKEALQARIVGQAEAVEAVARTVWKGRTSLKDPQRPVGVLLFIGPTGVGKTELALVLAEQLYGSPEAVIRLDMSEFQEAYTLSKLIGAAPGFVGYQDEGQLSGPLRRRPASIVLLDEADKVAKNTGILDLFLQLFDHGQMKDGQGRLVDGRNALFILTANIAPELAERRQGLGFAQSQSSESSISHDDIHAQLHQDFRPEFLNRIDEVVIFRQLDREDGQTIVTMNLERLRTRLKEQPGIEVAWDDSIVEFIVSREFSPRYGARALKRAIDAWIEKPLSKEMMLGRTGRVRLMVTEGQIVCQWE
jgi:ATP-dependent Clp protease ATP-binding subunit ClpC